MRAELLILISLLTLGWGEREREREVKRYLTKYGYPTDHMEAAVTMFQRLAGLKETGRVDEETFQQIQVPRCGALDVEEEEDHHHHDESPVQYLISDYPLPHQSLMSSEDIDRVVGAAARLWSVGKVRLERSDNAEKVGVKIVFCDLSQCLQDSSPEELARPVYNITTGLTTIYLDTNQPWADSSTLSVLAYGAAINLQVQLLQVKQYNKPIISCFE